MKKMELVATLAQKTEMEKVEVLLVLEAFFKEVKEQLSAGETVIIRGFGNFTVKNRAPKVARHINRNEPMVLPETKVPVFKPALALTESVKKGSKTHLKKKPTLPTT
ncbi:MAG TPA: HU family DNA-binding protein [Chitinophagales bacterium]|nr:HU family DNA-binding protein [Chitinophagales bacterium]